MTFKLNHALSLLLVLLPFVGKAQGNDWKEATSKNGKVYIRYQVSSVKDTDGEERAIAKYTATSKVDVDMDAAEKFLRRSENYKTILENTEVSKTVGTISENEWLLYLYMDIPWPFPDADCVQKVTVTRSERELIVSAVAKPDAYPLQDEQRMDISSIKYHFVKNDAGEIELTITGEFSPAGSINKFLLDTWFPKGPEASIDRLIEKVNAQ